MEVCRRSVVTLSRIAPGVDMTSVRSCNDASDAGYMLAPVYEVFMAESLRADRQNDS